MGPTILAVPLHGNSSPGLVAVNDQVGVLSQCLRAAYRSPTERNIEARYGGKVDVRKNDLFSKNIFRCRS